MGFSEDWNKFLDAVSPNTSEYRKQRERANEQPLSLLFERYKSEAEQGTVSPATLGALKSQYGQFMRVWPALEWNEVNRKKRENVNRLLAQIAPVVETGEEKQ